MSAFGRSMSAFGDVFILARQQFARSLVHLFTLYFGQHIGQQGFRTGIGVEKLVG